MTIVESLGLCFGIWDRSKYIQNAFVAKRCRDLTLFYIKSCFPSSTYIEHENIDELIRAAAGTKSRWLLVQANGHLLLRFDFYQQLAKVLANADSSFLVMGHILDRKHEYYEIHNQCFLINLELYRRLDRPLFGTYKSLGAALPKPVRSPENFHDDYTPPWLMPDGTQMSDYTNLHDGHEIIAASLRAGLRVQGFPTEIRDRKHFLYPEATTSEFEKCLRDPMIMPDQSLNQGQRRFLNGMRQNWFTCRSSIFLFNTDDIRNTQRILSGEHRLDALYSVASGFRPLKLLATNGFGPSTRVVYFDYSEAALNFRRETLGKFDGRNFIDFLRSQSSIYRFGHFQARLREIEDQHPCEPQFAEQFQDVPNYEVLEDLWRKCQEAFGGATEFQNLWQSTRKLPHSFIHTDLFNTPSAISDVIQADRAPNVLVWWSNCFTTESTRTFMPVERIEQAYRNFEFTLRGRHNPTFVDGFSDDGMLRLGILEN